MKFSKKFKSSNNTVNVVEMIDKLSQATGETKLFLAGCLGILNENNMALFTNSSKLTQKKGRIKRNKLSASP